MLYREALQYIQCTARSSLPVKEGRVQLRGFGALSHPGSAANPLTELFQYRALLVTSPGRHLCLSVCLHTCSRSRQHVTAVTHFVSFAKRTSKITHKIMQFCFRRNSNVMCLQLTTHNVMCPQLTTHNSLCCRVSCCLIQSNSQPEVAKQACQET